MSNAASSIDDHSSSRHLSSYSFLDYSGAVATVEPGRLAEAPPFLCAGSTPPWAEVLAHGWRNPEEEDEFDAQIDGLAVLEAMRRERAPVFPYDPASAEAFGIGGFVEWVRVGRAGVSIEISRRWPDQVGQLIDPFASAVPSNRYA